MRKSKLKAIIAILLGIGGVAAVFGCLYGFNSGVRNWVDNATGKISKNVPEELKNVTIDSTLELTANEIKAQGLQNKDKVDPVFNLKYSLKNMPKDYKGDDTLVTKVITGNQEEVYFASGANKFYTSMTHGNGDAFQFAHKAFAQSGKSEKYLIKTYWAAYPDIFLNSELVFKSDFKATIGEPMQIVDSANLTDSLKALQGMQIYNDDPATALIAPALKNKSDKISANPVLGHKVIYGDAEKISFANTIDNDSDGPIVFTHSNEFLVVNHEAFEETDQIENYVIRSYLVEDESIYLDSRISFKSDFDEDDVRDTTSYSVEFSMESEGHDLDLWNADEDKTCEVELSFDSDVDQLTFVRIVQPDGMNVPTIKIGAKTYRNGVVEVEDDDEITVKLDDIKNGKNYTYYIDYICLQETYNVYREAVTVHGYVASEHVSPGGSSSNPASSSAN